MKIRYLVAAAVMAYAPVAVQAATVEFVNQSSWEIHAIHLSPSNDTSWGEDYLGRDVLEKGDSLTLSDVSAGKWDVLVIDEDGDECIIEDVKLSNSDHDRWVIKDDDLLACQAGS